jgi:hypothetical protein
MSGYCRQVARFAPSLARSLTSTPTAVNVTYPTPICVGLPVIPKQIPIIDDEIEMMHRMSLQHAFPWTVSRPQLPIKSIRVNEVDSDEITYLEEMANKHSQCHFK